jgi:hypothetical protein
MKVKAKSKRSKIFYFEVFSFRVGLLLDSVVYRAFVTVT